MDTLNSSYVSFTIKLELRILHRETKNKRILHRDV